MPMIIRTATMADAKHLWEWRNDPVTRAMFREGEPVPWDQHLTWLTGMLADPERLLLIAESDSIPCATVRFDDQGNGVAEVSVTVAPEFRGRGVGTEALRQATALALQRWRIVLAHVKVENTASRKAFAGAGYEWVGEQEQYVTMIAGEVDARAAHTGNR